MAIPTNTVAPAVTGTATVGGVLTTTDGTWANAPDTFSYQWKRDGTPVGTDANTYTVVSGDVGHQLDVEVTATNVDGSSTPAASNLVDTIPTNTVAPAISGIAKLGQTLSATHGTWTGSPSSYAYQWKRAGSNIAGATGSTYVLTSADTDQAITCSVVATNGTGASAAAASNTLTPSQTAAVPARGVAGVSFRKPPTQTITQPGPSTSSVRRAFG